MFAELLEVLLFLIFFLLTFLSYLLFLAINFLVQILFIFSSLLFKVSINSSSILFLIFLNIFDEIIASIITINKKNQYIAANNQFTLHGADHSGCKGHLIKAINTSIVHTIKIIGIMYWNNSLQKYRQFLLVVSFIFFVDS